MKLHKEDELIEQLSDDEIDLALKQKAITGHIPAIRLIKELKGELKPGVTVNTLVNNKDSINKIAFSFTDVNKVNKLKEQLLDCNNFVIK